MRAARGWRALLQLSAVLAGEAAAIVVLHRLGALPFLQIGWEDPARWLAATAPEDVLLALCRLAGLGCAYWLLAGSVLYTLAAATRVPGAVRAVEWAALPSVRRVADRAVAVTLATSSVVGAGGTAWADAPTPPAPPPPVVATEAPSPDDDLYRPLPAGPSETATADRALPGVGSVAGVYFPDASTASWPGSAAGAAGLDAVGDPRQSRAMPTPVLAQAPAAPAVERPPRAQPPPPAPPAVTEHVVAPGDDLWSIAEARLAAELDIRARDVPREDVVVYWRQVVEANLDRLRSGDADVLQPGEVLQLPAPPA